jgi:urease accessory protein
VNLALLQLCDSLFPLGGFGYSDGLEWATSTQRVVDASQLGDWIDVCLDETIGRLEAPAVWQAHAFAAHANWRGIDALDEELIALRPSSAARKSTRAMGARLLTTWQAVRPIDISAAEAQQPRSLPIAFAIVCERSGIAQRDAVEAFAYTRLAATISAAMRLMAIGQLEAHTLLAAALNRIPSVVDAVAARDAPIESFAPMVDISTMSQQYLHSRLFRS